MILTDGRNEFVNINLETRIKLHIFRNLVSDIWYPESGVCRADIEQPAPGITRLNRVGDKL